MIREIFVQNLWKWKCGMREQEILLNQKILLHDLKRTEWDNGFEQLQRNRLVMGAFRYGRLSIPGKPVYDRISAAIHRLEEYKMTGNDELLVDVANFMMLEFVEGKHPLKHFESIDDGGHVNEKSK